MPYWARCWSKKNIKYFLLAAGSAYAFKRAQNGLIVICYFGEGAASEGIVFVPPLATRSFQNVPLFLVRKAFHSSLLSFINSMLTPYYFIFMKPRRCNTDPILAFKFEWKQVQIFKIFVFKFNFSLVGTVPGTKLWYHTSLPYIMAFTRQASALQIYKYQYCKCFRQIEIGDS